MQTFTSLLAVGVTAAASLTAQRFVTLAGGVPSAGAGGVGVARTSAASGERISVDVIGTAIVEAGGAITAGAAVECDNTGKAVALSSGVKLGRALTAAGASGDLIEVLLVGN